MALVRWRSLLPPIVIFVALVTVALAAQQRGGAPPAPAPNAAGANPNAIGVVNFEPIDGMLTRRLRFEAGARTNWHTHTHRQMLWAEEGRGLYQELGEPVKELVKDVPVLTKANVPHWHGAAPDSHVVQLTIYGGEIKWGAAVTDAEYLGKKK